MVSQDDLLGEGFQDFQLYDAPGQGQLHSLPTDEESAMVVDKGQKSDYMIQVRLVSCVHGTMSETTKKSASLVILEYRIKSYKKSRVFSSVRTSYAFTESKDPKAVGANFVAGRGVRVKAFAPFRGHERYNQTTAEESKTIGGKLTLGVGAAMIGELGVEGELQNSESHTQRYFDEGSAGLRRDEKRGLDNRVEWYIQHNRNQNHGVSPIFRLAILVERDDDELFYGHFLIGVEGGKRWDLAERIRNLIGAQEEPIIFNPSREPVWNEDVFDAAEVKELGVDRWNLGSLAKRTRLDKLSSVWGLKPLADDTAADE